MFPDTGKSSSRLNT